MGAGATWLIRPRAALVLGRVSNLPTVLSNVLAGAALADGGFGGDGDATLRLAAATLTLGLFYVGGMYLNDAFDADIDAKERPGRPIPCGDAALGAVFAAGFAMIVAATALTALIGGATALICGAALGVAIVAYDWAHKRTSAAPVLMGLCRFLAYLTAAAMVNGDLGAADGALALLLGAGGLFCHVVGLTYAARQEAYNRLGSVWPLLVLAAPLAGALAWALAASASPLALIPWVMMATASAVALGLLFRRRAGDVPRAVGLLIAAIALYDAALLAVAGPPAFAVAALLAFPATLALQRVVPGT